MKVLIIEDDRIKIEKFSTFFIEDNFTVMESYHSGLKSLLGERFDFLILDMTIPLWDKGNTDLGGNYEQFGGERILREMKRRKIMTPTILVTMFDVFPVPNGNLTFYELDMRYKQQFPQFYFGAVFYNASEESQWQKELRSLIEVVKKNMY